MRNVGALRAVRWAVGLAGMVLVPGGSFIDASPAAADTSDGPVSSFTYTPVGPVTGQTVHLDARGSVCPNAPCAYSWTDYPPTGGSWPLGSGQTVDFTFRYVGIKYVTLTVTDATGQSVSVEHDLVVAAATQSAPSNAALPAISGTATQGQTLTVSNGSWSGSPSGYSYQWRNCDSSGNNCTNVSGATGSSYQLTGSDVGDTVRVVVTATNSGGSNSATSDATAVVGGLAPTAAFSYSPASPVTKQSVHFDAGAARCYATPCSYGWEDDPPGAGIWPLGTGQTLDFTFQGVGTKYVTLVVTDALGHTATVEHDLVVAAATLSAPSNAALPAISGTATQGQTLTVSNGSWSGSPSGYGYQWRNCDSSGNNCTNVSGATGSSYQLTTSDVGDTVRVVVTATNSGGSNSATSAQSAVVQSGSTTGGGGGSTVVGTAAEPNVSCSSTISVGASVQSALTGASAGQVVCLNGGSWPAQTITGLTPASAGVTLAAKPGATVTMAGITTTGTVNNLTVEGIRFTDGFHVHAGANNITLKYNNFQNFADYAIELCSGCVNHGPSIDNVTMSYNQIDHTFYCFRVAGAGGHYAFTHNVCGPGIGQGGDPDAHYIQAEGNDNVTIDNNAFEGAANLQAIQAGAHLNVTHQCGNALEFNNNILWHTQAAGQALLWGDDCQVSGGQANNNLIVEDPSSPAPAYEMWIDNAHSSSNVTFSNNTVVNSTQYGGLVNQTPGFTAHYNLAANDAGNAYGGFGSCNCSNNASDDHSGDVTWSPGWQNTTWTPNNGTTWTPPPSNYYKPVVGAAVSTAHGYQGTVGP